MEKIRVGIIGTKFMGRAHSNAFINVPYFFDVSYKPVLRAACGRDEIHLTEFARRFGWETTETSWEKLVAREDIDLVDICTPNATHLPIALAAARAGKHILCEKPLAKNAVEARQMLDAVLEAGVSHMVAFNYRRVPALMFARQLIDKGKLGVIHHFNAVYYQDWLVDPLYPYAWRHDANQAGSGAHGDLNAHIIDLARFLVGEVEAVCGIQQTFIKERITPGGSTLPVTADDATHFLARFRNGAIGSFLATRFATGRKNMLRLEIFGSEGGISFDLERLNEVEYFSQSEPQTEQGYRRILVTENMHPYVGAWWPPGHIIGWEHTFVHEVKDLLEGIATQTPVAPDFYDGWRCQLVLDAVVESARHGRWISVPE